MSEKQTQNLTLVPPGPAGSWLSGCYRAFRAAPLEFLQEQVREHGETIRFRVGPRLYYYFQNPHNVCEVLLAGPHRLPRADAARQIAKVLGRGLVTTDGEQWKTMRRMTQPPLSQRRIQEFFPSVKTAVDPILSDWVSQCRTPKTCNVTERAFELAMTVSASCLLGVNVADQIVPLRRAIEIMGQFTMDRIGTPFRWPLWMPLPAHRQFLRQKDILDQLVKKILAGLRRSDCEGSDVLSHMVRSSAAKAGRPLTDRELRDQIVTIFLAGFDTTAAALAITLHLLASHPPIASAVQEELDQKIPGAIHSADQLDQLSVLRRVILESLRLYPTGPLFSRVAKCPLTIGRTPIPRRAEIWICPYLTHRHPAFWKNPGCFDPARWEGQTKHPLAREDYLPFGKGPHTCIGAGLALLELTYILAALLKQVDIAPINADPIRPVAKIALATEEDILLRVEKRKVT